MAKRFRLLPEDLEQGWLPYGYLVYLCGIPVSAYYAHVSANGWIATLTGIAVFLLLYFRAYWVDGPELVAIVAGMATLGFIFKSNPSTVAYFIFGAASIAWIARPSAASYRTLAIYVAVIAVVQLLIHVPASSLLISVMFSSLVGAALIRFAENRCASAALQLAHDEVERLAKVAERERIARDLHDVLGHTLSVIVLKSELAAKLADRDPPRAAAEIGDVERIARESLGELREALAGYRAAGLDAEFARARSVLETAGVDVACETQELALSPAQEGVLALAVREGVTNIVRHARAQSCRLRLARENGALRLEIADDGSGFSAAEGFGLTGMRERVEALGGTLTREIANGTRLTLTLPLRADAR
ncbi:MAG: sensor histidine kinase [Candidatus Velthaea sp.]